MHIRKFVKSLHMPALTYMLQLRDHPVPSTDEIPEIGFIIYELDTPVATAFLRRCEGNYAQIDGLASNVKCSSEQRHSALDAAIQACILTAKELRISNLYAFSKDGPTIERSERHGFVKLPAYSLLAYDLNPEA